MTDSFWGAQTNSWFTLELVSHFRSSDRRRTTYLDSSPLGGTATIGNGTAVAKTLTIDD